MKAVKELARIQAKGCGYHFENYKRHTLCLRTHLIA